MNGLVTRLASGRIVAGGRAKATYKYADPSKVKAGDIIGGVDVDGMRKDVVRLAMGLESRFRRREE